MVVTEETEENGCEGSVGIGEEDNFFVKASCCVGGYFSKSRPVQSKWQM